MAVSSQRAESRLREVGNEGLVFNALVATVAATTQPLLGHELFGWVFAIAALGFLYAPFRTFRDSARRSEWGSCRQLAGDPTKPLPSP